MEFLNVFASVDKDHDLIIYKEDLDNYAAEMNYQKAFTTKWLRLFDNDKDGRITFTEFCETLGLDEKIYEEKLKGIRRNIELKRQQQEREQKAAAAKKPEVEEDTITVQSTRKIRTAAPPPKAKSEKEEKYFVEISDGPDPSSEITVEYSELQQEDLVKVTAAVADGQELARSKQATNSEQDRQVMRSLEKSLGKGWRSQTNPSIDREEVQHEQGCMAVLRTASGQRVMVWKAEESAGCCCCC